MEFLIDNRDFVIQNQPQQMNLYTIKIAGHDK